MPPALAIGGAAVVGGVAGALGSKQTQSSTSGLNLDPLSDAGNQGSAMMMNGANQFQSMVDAGPGQQDVTNATNSSRSLAQMLQMYANGGYNPTGADLNTGNQVAANMFAPQQTQLKQNFVTQTQQANQQAAALGRSTNDPILQAKLLTNQSNQMATLNANQGAYAQQYALNAPMQRLGFAQNATQIQSGLATQAMSNRQALAAMGSGILNNAQNYQLATAQHYGNETQTSGGGIGGAISGALGGAGAGMSMASSFANMNMNNAMTNQITQGNMPGYGTLPGGPGGSYGFGFGSPSSGGNIFGVGSGQ